MNSHELAKQLLGLPDLPVVSNLDEENYREVEGVSKFPSGTYLVSVSKEGYVAWDYRNGPHIQIG